MNIESVLSWIACGLFVGAIARLLVPGGQPMSLFMTMVLGIVGALVGGFLYSLIRGPTVEPFSLSSHTWYGWTVAILGAMLVVWIYPQFFPRKWYA